MRKIVWRAALVGMAFWSVFAWIAYSLVDIFGSGAASVGTVPGFPAEPFTFAWIAAKLHGLGLSAVFTGWLIGIAVILGIASLVQRLFGLRPPERLPGRQSWGSSIPSGSFGSSPRPGVLRRLVPRHVLVVHGDHHPLRHAARVADALERAFEIGHVRIVMLFVLPAELEPGVVMQAVGQSHHMNLVLRIRRDMCRAVRLVGRAAVDPAHRHAELAERGKRFRIERVLDVVPQQVGAGPALERLAVLEHAFLKVPRKAADGLAQLALDAAVARTPDPRRGPNEPVPPGVWFGNEDAVVAAETPWPLTPKL